jgi:hypothetical protein
VSRDQPGSRSDEAGREQQGSQSKDANRGGQR